MYKHLSPSLNGQILTLTNVCEFQLNNIKLTIYSPNKMGKTLCIAAALSASKTKEIFINDNKLLNNKNKFIFSYTINTLMYFTDKIRLKTLMNVSICSDTLGTTSLSTSPSTTPSTSPSLSPSSSISFESLICSSETDKINFDSIGAFHNFDSGSKSHSETLKKTKSSNKQKRKRYVILYEDDIITTRTYINKRSISFSIENESEKEIFNVKVKLFYNMQSSKAFKTIKFGDIDDLCCKKKRILSQDYNYEYVFINIKYESNKTIVNEWGGLQTTVHKTPRFKIIV